VILTAVCGFPQSPYIVTLTPEIPEMPFTRIVVAMGQVILLVVHVHVPLDVRLPTLLTALLESLKHRGTVLLRVSVVHPDTPYPKPDGARREVEVLQGRSISVVVMTQCDAIEQLTFVKHQLDALHTSVPISLLPAGIMLYELS